ncbi:MAG: fasciclin domain-containing protein [Porphyromonadaceae bacterium]|nr:fasciclin domain-containing protein [Porphyromonadaceae bacterium]
MKTIEKNKQTVRKHLFIVFTLLVGGFLFFQSCDSDKILDENLYTFQDKMMGQFLTDSADFSEFARLLDTTNVMGLLNTYGTYTCFAPNNEAMKKYYTLHNKSSLSDFTLDTLKLIAYDHIINGDEVLYSNFVNGILPQTSMSDRYISISFGATGNAIVNKTSNIIENNVMVHNGVLHLIDEVLNPVREGIVEVLAADQKFTLFYEALIATGLADSLLRTKDDTYNPEEFDYLIDVPREANQWFYQEIPLARKFGYTIFVESNETLASYGITDLESMKAKAAEIYDLVYPADANITDTYNRKNSLNRFIAYHLVNKQLGYSKLIDAYDTGHMVKNVDMYEYLEPMCPNTLIEIKKERLSGETNLINFLREKGSVIRITANRDNPAGNGVYHEIDGLLVYSQDVEAEHSTKRLRFDSASFFPELINNNMRGRGVTSPGPGPNLQFKLPRNYIDRLYTSEQTVVSYLTADARYQNYQGDEIFLGATSGNLYDFSIVTPPIPAGTYEVRFGYLTNGKRGVAQLYFDNIPAGVPLNLNNYATDVAIGYETPGTVQADLEGFENDKMMRNRGYMKGPAAMVSMNCAWSCGQPNSRYSPAALRRILGTYVFEKAENHLFTVKGLSGGEFMFDYLEFVPTNVLESEDIY